MRDVTQALASPQVHGAHRKLQRIGRYYLTDRIAYGGMAEIFRGVTCDKDGHRIDVAVKRLFPHFVEDDQFVVMLTDEFRLVSQLKHPHIAAVYELARVGNHLLISLEYVDGKDLRSTAERARAGLIPLPFEHLAYILARALDGLHFAHEATDKNGDPLRIVHRDFTPSNILVGYDGNVKICDFGIAKATQNRVQTRAGVIKGKVRYMSPEQASGHALDLRSDIFSAGSVLYELCTGEAPFQARSEIDLIFKVREAHTVDCHKLNPNIPNDLAEIIRQAMAPDPAHRFQSAAEFRDALVGFLRDASPDFRRARLAKLMKHLWQDEIEIELRQLEDFVMSMEELLAARASETIERGETLVSAGPIPTPPPPKSIGRSPGGVSDSWPAPVPRASSPANQQVAPPEQTDAPSTTSNRPPHVRTQLIDPQD